MKRLWINLPDRLTDGLPGGKILFMAIFSVFLIVANLPGVDGLSGPGAAGRAGAVTEGLLAAGYLGLSALSVFLLVPLLQRHIRSGLKLLEPQAGAEPGPRLRAWRWLYPVAAYGGVIAVILFIGLGLSDVWTNLDPSFGRSVDAHSAHTGYVAGALMSLLASTEEVWRWSMIVLVLLLFRRLAPARWQKSTSWRWAGMAAAVVISSLLFGLGHVGEYPGYGLTTWLALSSSGLVLALCTIVTRRLITGMLVHFVYDYVAFTNVLQRATDTWLLLALGAGLLLLAACAWCLQGVWSRLNIALSDGHAPDPLPFGSRAGLGDCRPQVGAS